MHLHEITKQGSDAFPFRFYTSRIADNVYGYMPLHWHDEIQFFIVTEGEVLFTIQQSPILLKQGEGVFINANVLHSARSHNNNDGTILCFMIDPYALTNQKSVITNKYIEPLVQSKSLDNIKLISTVKWQSDLIEQLKILYGSYSKQTSYYEIDVYIVLLQILSQIVKNTSSNLLTEDVSIASEDVRSKAMLEYIHENYDKKITLDDLARSVNLSRSEYCRSFKRVIECTPTEYLTGYRLNKSVYYIKYTSKSVSEISSDVGFGSVSYFIKKFKEKMGMTPNEYKKECD